MPTHGGINMPIITSLLDTDFYSFTQQQFIFHQFPDTEVEYEFKCRTPGVDLSPYAEQIRQEINHLCSITFTKKEIIYLRSLNIFKENYLSFLEKIKLSPHEIILEIHPFNLKIEGSWLETILFETPILAIISEVCLRNGIANFKGNTRLGDKINLIKHENIKFIDFGTRRRFSFDWHAGVINELKNELPNQFIGTSNVYFAMKYKLAPKGTHSHQILQAGQSLAPSLKESQTYMLKKWLDEYNGKLGIALTDVISMDAFLEDFKTNYLGLSYSGCRHDSGDPFIWGEKLIMFYKRWGIDPKSRTAVFSDGLTFPRMIKINNQFKDRISCVFGIGTNLTNDVGIEPLRIVIKMTKCNGKPVAKISDTPEKGMCRNREHLKKLKEAFKI